MPSGRTNQQKLALFKRAFRGRVDIHGTRDVTTGTARCVKTAPNDNILVNHLCGRQPVGVYPLVGDRVWFAAIDMDDHDPEPVLTLYQIAQALGQEPLIERSKSKGWHLWWFADQAGWPAATIRRLLMWMTAEVNRPAVEVFPKQDRLPPGGYGNFIFLPLDGRLVPKARTLFVQPTRWLPPAENQWDVLAGRQQCTEAQIDEAITSADIGQLELDTQEFNGPVGDATSTDKPVNFPQGNVLSQNIKETSQDHGEFRRSEFRGRGFRGLPPCARRMLAQGVTEHQRVACFRLAVHLHRLGIPDDIAKTVLKTWAAKNRPTGGKRVITQTEIVEQTACAYTGRYRGYGCEDPTIAQYCGDQCPVQRVDNSIGVCNTLPGSHA